jgi:hypothetical protein
VAIRAANVVDYTLRHGSRAADAQRIGAAWALSDVDDGTIVI